MGSCEGHCSGTAMGTAIVGVSFGQALIRLLTVAGCWCWCCMRSAAYCVLESAARAWRRIGLCDLSPFLLRVGVRGPWGGPEGRGRGASVWESLRGGARSTSQSQHQDGQPHGLAFGVQRNSHALRTLQL